VARWAQKIHSYLAVQPPSIDRHAPLNAAEFGPQRWSTKAPMSSGRTNCTQDKVSECGAYIVTCDWKYPGHVCCRFSMSCSDCALKTTSLAGKKQQNVSCVLSLKLCRSSLAWWGKCIGDCWYLQPSTPWWNALDKLGRRMQKQLMRGIQVSQPKAWQLIRTRQCAAFLRNCKDLIG